MLSQWRECVYGVQSWKELSVFCESVVVQIDKWTLILKMVERDVFPMKAKHQYHLSQWEKSVYGGQSQKNRRLLCESIFVQIDRWALIRRMVEIEVFFMKLKHRYL